MKIRYKFFLPHSEAYFEEIEQNRDARPTKHRLVPLPDRISIRIPCSTPYPSSCAPLSGGMRG